jgi:hypothetical protein
VAAATKRNKKSAGITILKVPLDAITQANALEITFNLTITMNQ